MSTQPQPCNTIVFGGHVLDPTDSATSDEAVAIAGTDIVDVGSSDRIRKDWSAANEIDARSGVISPGFVDAHVHLSAFLAAATAYAPPTAEGMFSGGSNVREIVPFIAQMTSMTLPTELTATVLRAAFAAMLKSGITSVVDAGSSGHDGIVQAANEAGIRAAIGPSLADSWHDNSGSVGRRVDHRELLDVAEAWLSDNTSHDGLVLGLVSAVETIACSDELLAGIARLAERFDVPTNIHSHITEASDQAHLEVYGRTATERLVDTGMFSERCVTMHVGNADSTDIEAMVSAGVTVNHNPLGNAMLGFGTSRKQAIPAMVDAGIPIVLGSDYAPSMVATPFDTMHATLAMHREAVGTDNALSLEQVIAMSTNAGVAVGRPGRLGRLTVGSLADVVVIDTSGSHHLGDRHPVPSVALRARPHDVQTVIVNGRTIVDDGQVLSIDETAALEEAQALLASMR